MSGRRVARVVFAPIVIAFAITAIRPAQPDYSQVTERLETKPATAIRDIDQTTERPLETAAVISPLAATSQADVALASDQLGDRPLPAAANDESAPESEPQLAEIAPPETQSVPVVAPPETQSVPVVAPPETVNVPAVAPPETQSVSVVAPPETVNVPVVALASSLPLPAPPEIEETASVTVAEETAPTEPAPESIAAAVQITPPEPQIAAPETQIAAPETKAAVPEVEIAVPTQPAASPPDEEPKIAREDKPEEKQVFASLALPVTVVDTSPPAADRFAAEEVKDREYKPSAAEPEDRHIDYARSNSPASPSEAGSVPMSPPAKLRALTRADIPPPEQFASLGSGAHSDARKAAPALSGILPPEHQRVAHDAPPITERPKSIGKRHYIDETKYAGLGSPEALLEALRHVGANAKALGLPARLWCTDFMNLVLRKSGLKATGSRAARSYLQYGQQIDGPRVGAIAIFTRGRRGGHVGIVRGTDGNGNPIIVSGNYSNKVAEAVYPKSRVIAYVVPR